MTRIVLLKRDIDDKRKSPTRELMLRLLLETSGTDVDVNILYVDVDNDFAFAQSLNMHGPEQHVEVDIFSRLSPHGLVLCEVAFMGTITFRVEAVLIDMRSCLQPKATEVGIDLADINTVNCMRRKRAS